MPFDFELPQPIRDWLIAIPQNALWFAIGTCVVMLVTLGIVLCIGRLLQTGILYAFLLIGFFILAGDVYIRHFEDAQTWTGIYREYSPHFASEILITFIAVAILENSIKRRERRHEIRGAALGGLRFFVRFCEQHDCRFTQQQLHRLSDERNAFNARKANRIAQISRTERTHYEDAAQAVEALVQAVSDSYTPPAPNVDAETRQQSIVDAAHDLRTRYQVCRTVFWQAADPDRIE
jgi:hypothetical protein